MVGNGSDGEGRNNSRMRGGRKGGWVQRVGRMTSGKLVCKKSRCEEVEVAADGVLEDDEIWG